MLAGSPWGKISTMDKLLANRKQFLIIGLLVLSFFLLMDLNSRLSDLVRLTNRKDQVATDVANLQSTADAIRTAIAYATSPAAVDEWARSLGKMGKPGDNPIVPLVPPNTTPEVKTYPTPTPRVVQHWEKWWELFFGK